MRIVHLIHTMGVAGAEKHLLFLLPELKKRGIECELICVTSQKTLFIEKAILQKFEEAGIQTTLFSWRSKFQLLGIAHKISRYLKAKNYSILHAHLFYGDFIAAIIKAIFFRNLTILSTKHGYKEDFQLSIAYGRKTASHNVYYLLSRWILKRIDHNLAVSKAISDVFFDLKLVPQRMQYVHHGIKLPATNMYPPIVEGDPKILTVGRLEMVKGHVYLIKALPKIIEQFPQLKLIVLGNGSLKDELIDEAVQLGVRQHIEFVGFAAPEAYAGQCQLMAIPSLFEAFGLVYIEAYAMRLPLIAFDGGAAKEIIDDGDTGILVQAMDVNALAGKVIYLLQHPDAQKKLIENAFKEFQKKFTVEVMAAATIEWYESVLNK